MKTWGIRLGSYGRYVSFCEQHGIIGIGWENIPLDLVEKGDYEKLRTLYGIDGRAFGTLTRFVGASIGDYVFYYVPAEKEVRLVKIVGNAEKRDFSLELGDVDIWFCRKVQRIPFKPSNRIDFNASLRGSLFGYRGSFWCIEGEDKGSSHADLMAQGEDPSTQKNAEIQNAYNHLCTLIRGKMDCLSETDFEQLVADYLEGEGIRIQGSIGGTQPIIDCRGIGPFGMIYKAQVKRTKEQISKKEIETYLKEAGEYDRFIFASFYGFTEDAADAFEDSEDVKLIEAESDELIRLILSQKCSPRILGKLRCW